MTDLNYPDINVLPIFNGRVPKQQSLVKIAQQHYSKRWPWVCFGLPRRLTI